MPPLPKRTLTLEEQLLLGKFERARKFLPCQSCGVPDSYNRDGVGRIMQFKCKRCGKKVSASVMSSMLKEHNNISRYLALPDKPLSPALPTIPSTPAARRPSLSNSVYPMAPQRTTIPNISQHSSPASPQGILVLDSQKDHASMATIHSSAISDVSATPPSFINEPISHSKSMFQEILIVLKQLQTTNNALLEENKCLQFRMQALDDKVGDLQKTKEQCSVCYNHSLQSDPLPEVLSQVAPIISDLSRPTTLGRNGIPRDKGKAPMTYAEALNPLLVTSACSSRVETNLPSPTSNIPNTLAGRALSKVIKTSKHQKDKAAAIPQALETSSSSPQPAIQSSPKERNSKATYKPPANLPPPSNWVVLYFSQVPWTTISNIRKTFRNINLDTSKIVNLAWRRGKVLEIILDRNCSQAFSNYLEKNLHWIPSNFSILPAEALEVDTGIFKKPPAHMAIMAFFAAIKRQAPSYDIAYFLKEYAINILKDITEAPFDTLWDSSGPLERAQVDEPDSSA